MVFDSDFSDTAIAAPPWKTDGGEAMSRVSWKMRVRLQFDT